MAGEVRSDVNEKKKLKYPNSAALFQFCRKILDHKFGGIRVIDQDIGQILNFDPADCSHWKKGKKNIKSIKAIRSIADHLGVDQQLVVDVASGDIDQEEAFYEFSGYGSSSLDPKLVDQAKKEFYRKNPETWSKQKEDEFESYLYHSRKVILGLVENIHKNIDFRESPLYLPEISNHYSEITIKAHDKAEGLVEDEVLSAKTLGGHTTVCYPSTSEVRPFLRFKIAREIGRHFIGKKASQSGMKLPAFLEKHAELEMETRCNFFASHLLVPSFLIKTEMHKVDVSRDIVSQFAESFWVSKKFMNLRIKDVLENL